jgi:hypothetical protein
MDHMVIALRWCVGVDWGWTQVWHVARRIVGPSYAVGLRSDFAQFIGHTQLPLAQVRVFFLCFY